MSIYLVELLQLGMFCLLKETINSIEVVWNFPSLSANFAIYEKLEDPTEIIRSSNLKEWQYNGLKIRDKKTYLKEKILSIQI